jgi:hypothetical protein
MKKETSICKDVELGLLLLLLLLLLLELLENPHPCSPYPFTAQVCGPIMHGAQHIINKQSPIST